MIERISTNSVNSGRTPSPKQPQFRGLPDMVLNGALNAIQLCEQNPMVNVAVLDVATAIAPRTIIESETNPYAGFEAFRRESSGLIINCMIPGLIVAGIAKVIQNPIMGKGSGMSNCWANEETIDLITNEWKKAPDKAFDKNGKILYQGEPQKAKSYNTIKSILEKFEGVDGKETKAIKNLGDFDESIKELAEKSFIQKYTSADRKALNKAWQNIVEKTHISENIKIINSEKYFGQSLESVFKSTPRIIRELVNGRDAKTFANNAKTLLNAKSIGGMAVILPLAISAQPINRWITAKTSGKKGAPIYKDFTQTQSKVLTGKEKAALFSQKLISVSCMIGVALLSIMKKPDGKMLKSITQFKGVFPSMDQARLISTATFASRMMASEDKNDLREATVRDIATFSAFYFLGDYVAKGIASVIQKVKGTELINVLEKAPDKNAGIGKKIWHWTKNTALKSSDELVGTKAKQMRAVCQIGNIAFSLVALGLLIPKINRKKTDKKREEELKKMGMDQQTINKYYPHFLNNNPNFASKDNASRGNVYKAFFTSK